MGLFKSPPKPKPPPPPPPPDPKEEERTFESDADRLRRISLRRSRYRRENMLLAGLLGDVGRSTERAEREHGRSV